MRTTVRDVAREAGVSHRTVVNVLNGRQGEASETTRNRVITAARKLNYIPVAQPAAQHCHVETRVIGLVFDENDWENSWGIRTFQGLREGARQFGYDLLTIIRDSPDWALDGQELRLLDRRSDGLIFMTPRNRTASFEKLIKHNIPAVSCYMDDVPEGVACVTVDNKGAMMEAVRYLVQMGHENILHLTSTQIRSDFQHRREGYCAAMAEAGLTPQYHACDPKAEWVDSAMEQILESKATAILCVSDSLVFDLLPLLKEAGLRVPEDISLFGMDDEPFSIGLGLTTVHISGVDIGRLAVETMVAMIGGGKAAENHKLAPHHIVYRTSVAPPRAS